ncbi:hypothetical protein F183_A30500 [Bryobacterales bacterium F-183]|nr:hypothetical protein F183_A30500 [Bryobacterales bacterium F-183]
MAASLNPVWIEPVSSPGSLQGVEWVARSGKWQSALDGTRFRFASETEQVAVRFAGARALRAAEPEGLLPGTSSYFTGADPSQWRTKVPHYARLRYRDVYPGIDVVYYASSNGQLEYDFEVSPTADPSRIRLEFDGVARVTANATGDLVLTTTSGQTLTHRRPVVFEESRVGVRRALAASYRVDRGAVTFAVAARRDPGSRLIIDPVVEYSTFLGGSALDSARAIACEATEFCYLAGEGRSLTGLVGALQSSGSGGQEVIVIKINHQTNAVVYYAVIGGDLDDVANAIRVDSTGAAYVAGTTKSQNFPTRNAAQPASGGSLLNDAFVLKLEPAGNALVYSTYIGGTGADEGRALAVDRSGAAYVVGSTGSRDNFPVTPGVFQTSFRGTILQQSTTGFVVKVNRTGSQFAYSTFFGGSRQDDVRAVAVDDAGNAILAGTTTSLDFPMRNPTFGLLASAISGFVAKLNAEGTQPLFSTYFGGPANNSIDALAMNAAGDLFVGGWTNAAGFPVKNAAQPDYAGGTNDGFVAKFSAGAYELAWATYLGGSSSDRVAALALHGDGSVTAVGQTGSRNFPQYNSPFFPSPKTDAFATRIASAGNRFVSSVLIGGAEDEAASGAAVDAGDAVLVTGATASRDFPLRGAGQGAAFGGGTADMFLLRLTADQVNTSLTPNPLSASASSVSFVATTGDVKPPPPASIQITAASGGNVGFTVEWSLSGSNGGNWLSAGPSRAETPATLNVFANPASMPPGTYNGTVRLIPVAGGDTTSINVTFQVLNPRAVITGVFPSWIAPGAPDTEVEIQGRGFAQGATIRMTSEDANGAQVLTPLRITGNSMVFSAAKAFLFRDTSFELRVLNPEAESSNAISLMVGGVSNIVAPTSIVSAANGIATGIAPGQMLVINGRGLGPGELTKPDLSSGVVPNRLAGVRVLFNGIAAPLLFVWDRQICVMAPFALAGYPSADIVVESQNNRSQILNTRIVPVQPGILTPDSWVYGYGALWNESGAEITKATPARKGTVVTFFVTGAGLLQAPKQDGWLNAPPYVEPLAGVGVEIDGQPTEVVRVEDAPGQVAGLVQVRARIPATVASGEVSLAVRVGDVLSSPVKLNVE